MSKMKYSGVEWIGSIPKEWGIFKLKKYCELENGFSFKSDDYVDGSDTLCCRMSNIRPDGTFDILYSATYLPTEYKKKYNKYLLEDNDIIIAMTDMAGDPKILGVPTKVITKGYNLLLNQRVGKLIIIDEKIDSEFLKFAMSSESTKTFYKIMADKNVQLNIGKNDVLNIKIPIPSFAEQKMIANFFDKNVNELDGVLNDLSRQIKILNKYKKSIITEKVIGGLNSKVKYKKSNVEWIGNIPEHWQVKLIKNICILKGRIGWEGLTKDEYISEGPILITGINFSNGNIDWDSCEHVSEWRFNQDKSIQIKNNDLLITKDGTVGKVALVSNCPNQVTLNSGVLLLRPIANNYVEKYLYYVLLSNEFWHWFDIENIGNTTITHLYQNRFGKFKLALPSIEEQKEIVEYLDKKCKQIDKIIEDKQKQIEKIEEYKKSVIYEYVTGKKRVEGAEELYG